MPAVVDMSRRPTNPVGEDHLRDAFPAVISLARGLQSPRRLPLRRQLSTCRLIACPSLECLPVSMYAHDDIGNTPGAELSMAFGNLLESQQPDIVDPPPAHNTSTSSFPSADV